MDRPRYSPGKIVVMAILVACAGIALFRYYYVTTRRTLNEIGQIRETIQAAEQDGAISEEEAKEIEAAIASVDARMSDLRPEEKARFLLVKAHWTARGPNADPAAAVRLYKEGLEADRRIRVDPWIRSDLERMLRQKSVSESEIRSVLEQLP